MLTQTGYGGKTVPLSVEDEGRIVEHAGGDAAARRRIGDGARCASPPTDAGPRLFRFKVPTQAGEQVTQNNARDALIEVRDRREKVLYFEGEPRFETKFIRRAVEDDKNLQVVVLQRTAENKYYRRRRRRTPTSSSAAFRRRARSCSPTARLILGSVEAASFSPDQLRMIADFVSKRGGGLLMLGGRRSFAEGGWAGTPVGEVLPVRARQRRTPKYFSEVPVRPTRAGATIPVTQIAGDEAASAATLERHAGRHDGQPDPRASSRARPCC